MSLTPSTRSTTPEPIDPSPLHLKVYYSTRPGRFPSVDDLPHPTDPFLHLSILANTTLLMITHLAAPQLPQHLLSPPTSDPHPSDIIGARLAYCLVYPITATYPRAPPKYEIKNLGVVTIGDTETPVSSAMLSEYGFVTGDLLYVAIVREGESIPPVPTFATERPSYNAPRGGERDGRDGLEGQHWARGGGFYSGRGRRGGRDRDRDAGGGWRRGEEVPQGSGERDEWAYGSGGRGRGGGIGWTRGGGGKGGRDRW